MPGLPSLPGYPDPAPGREAAAERWMRALAVVVVVGFIGGLLSALAVFVTLPDAVLGVGFGIFVFAVIGLLTCFIGIGWTRAMPWYRSLWRAGKATLRGICELF